MRSTPTAHRRGLRDPLTKRSVDLRPKPADLLGDLQRDELAALAPPLDGQRARLADSPYRRAPACTSYPLRGDLDGDGLSDLAVTARTRGTGELGVVYVMFAPFPEQAAISDADARLTGSGGRAGFDLSTGGDVNGDGYDDLMAGTSLQSTGYAYLLLGPLDDGSYTTSTLDGKLSLTESLAYFGRNLSIEQDLNGDGRDDVAVGARNSNLYTPQVGTTFIFYDAPLGHVDAGEADAFVHSETHMEFDLSNGMGTVVESTGDMNGDGYEELLIGSVSNYYFYVLFGGPT